MYLSRASFNCGRATALKKRKKYDRIRAMEIEKAAERLRAQEDRRRTERGNIRHKPEDVIIIGLCILICNGEDFADMEEFGKEREEWLRQFLTLPNGIPNSDTFRRVFERISPEALSECL